MAVFSFREFFVHRCPPSVPAIEQIMAPGNRGIYMYRCYIVLIYAVVFLCCLAGCSGLALIAFSFCWAAVFHQHLYKTAANVHLWPTQSKIHGLGTSLMVRGLLPWIEFTTVLCLLTEQRTIQSVLVFFYCSIPKRKSIYFFSASLRLL